MTTFKPGDIVQYVDCTDGQCGRVRQVKEDLITVVWPLHQDTETSVEHAKKLRLVIAETPEQLQDQLYQSALQRYCELADTIDILAKQYTALLGSERRWLDQIVESIHKEPYKKYSPRECMQWLLTRLANDIDAEIQSTCGYLPDLGESLHIDRLKKRT